MTNAGGIAYDSAEYKVTVTVADNGSGLETAVTYEDGDIVFNNTYNADRYQELDRQDSGSRHVQLCGEGRKR